MGHLWLSVICSDEMPKDTPSDEAYQRMLLTYP